MSRLKAQVFRVCPKSGKIVGVRKPQGLIRVFFPIIGFLALAWFLLRVVPKPSRAAYPCQKVAMPLASGFVLWLAGMTTASLAFRSAQGRLRQARYLSGGLAIVIALVGVGWGSANLAKCERLASAGPDRSLHPPPGQPTHRAWLKATSRGGWHGSMTRR